MHLQAALGQFQVQLRADGRSEHTRAQYERHVTGLIAWLQAAGRRTDVKSVTPASVAEFFASDAARLSARGGSKKATSANAQRTSLRCFLRWAHESGFAPTNAARLLKRARCAPAPPRALHADEQKRLLQVLADAQGAEAARDRMLVELLLGTGVRIGSAIGLDVSDVDFDHGEIALRTTKGDRPASVVLSGTVAKQLRRFLGKRKDGPVFLANGHRVSIRHVQRRITSWMAAAGIQGKSTHSLRHSFAMRIYESSGDLLLTQAAMGHASIASTTCYARVGRARLRAAVGA
jgi:integrase/recombinase XerC